MRYARIASTLIFLLSWSGAALAGSADFSCTRGWSFKAETWLASGSNFDEQPGPLTAGHVWGKFDTSFYQLDVEKNLPLGLTIGVTAGLLNMHPNTMYLHSETLTTEFDGSGLQLAGNLYYSPLRLGRSELALGIGYQTVSAIKRFHDLAENGLIILPGNWGDYRITYSGPQFTARGAWWFSSVLGVGASVIGSPMLSNHTEVSGWGDLQVEEAQGLRFKLEGKIMLAPLENLDLSAGYRYEDVYFDPPADDSFSLAIIYSGAWLGMDYHF